MRTRLFGQEIFFVQKSTEWRRQSWPQRLGPRKSQNEGKYLAVLESNAVILCKRGTKRIPTGAKVCFRIIFQYATLKQFVSRNLVKCFEGQPFRRCAAIFAASDARKNAVTILCSPTSDCLHSQLGSGGSMLEPPSCALADPSKRRNTKEIKNF